MIVFIDPMPSDFVRSLNLPPTELLQHLQAGLGVDPQQITYVHAIDDDLPALTNDIDAIFIGGSIHMVGDGLAWQAALEAWVRAAMEAAIPMLGYCYGHQTIAKALGGTVGEDPTGREFGITSLTKTEAGKNHYLLQGLPDTFMLPVSHRESVLVAPKQAVLLAEVTGHPSHILAFNDQTIGLQAEFLYDFTWMEHLATFRKHKYLESGFVKSEAELQSLVANARAQSDVVTYYGQTIATNFMQGPVKRYMQTKGRQLDALYAMPKQLPTV